MKRMWKKYVESSLILKISLALVLGVIAGLIFGKDAAILTPFGDLLLRLLKFMIIPLVTFTLIVGVNQTKIGNLGRMGGKVFLYYVITSALAIIVGITIGSIFEPGTGMTIDTNEKIEVPENPGVMSVLLSIVPDNIFTAFTELNLLGIVFTALVFGIAISALRSSEKWGETGELVYNVIEGLNEATFKIMQAILLYIPIGIFAIIAKTVGNQGVETLTSLGNMVLVLYVALLVQVAVYILFMLFTKVSLKDFFTHARTPILTAFVTQSSSGTLPLTLDAAKKLNLNKGLYGFSLPFGATVNMDGAAIRIAISAVFAANIIGDPLTFTDMLQIVIVGTLATIGTAGVPGAGIIMIATVFAQVGLPMEAVAILTAIDALVGMGATALNVTGDLVATTVINETEKKHQAEPAYQE
ncbi:dicarboxylate/amino acid:cation symporter [Virgibacillus halodenitrificans]|uniref:Dicarboxylate/amino acid:cation symporter n=1 Tax=Virgibacillus halodenitrificans TaxID=1482 RepID=A0AAC9IZ71_VIRHA|nr:dicarboxylate/amino acid:cation symporter [Virgibacillus halodenitrificans]APC47884.1 dicarboxylate/amino acid:cation symporter [Virgibacillus halodenitrificans]MCJ0932485.1 dicarboxylate/amino acid:cation symporter [Virgibacillus halodenitrificans]MEC2160141.1 dicarboxylate/amino acid:cation symporter [Virgibacillus halodenitrificans]WHX27891.1 dicarboxylate/amino acid:cation symporter [Virgibacillus halodenitrificans]